MKKLMMTLTAICFLATAFYVAPAAFGFDWAGACACGGDKNPPKDPPKEEPKDPPKDKPKGPPKNDGPDEEVALAPQGEGPQVCKDRGEEAIVLDDSKVGDLVSYRGGGVKGVGDDWQIVSRVGNKVCLERPDTLTVPRSTERLCGLQELPGGKGTIYFEQCID